MGFGEQSSKAVAKATGKMVRQPALMELVVNTLSVFAPAKINLLLAITGRRPDGFHNLVSLVAPLCFGDELSFEPAGVGEGVSQGFRLHCSAAGVPLDASNLILRAAALHAEATGRASGGRFSLVKRIPMGAGLGGGSSDASAALQLLDQASERPLGAERLDELASRIGSDCPLFLRRRAIVMRGRGEQVELLTETVAARLKGQRVLLFKPDFGISMPWAYKQMVAAAPASYLAPELAEERLQRWLGDPSLPLSELLFNNMEAPAFCKYLALPALLRRLREDFELPVLMSGSGSCCFALLSEKSPIGALRNVISEAWGEDCFIQETELS